MTGKPCARCGHERASHSLGYGHCGASDGNGSKRKMGTCRCPLYLPDLPHEQVKAAITEAMDRAFIVGRAKNKKDRAEAKRDADIAYHKLLAYLALPSHTPRTIALTHEILAAQGRVADMILRKTGRMAVGLDDWATIDSLCAAVATACGCVLEGESNMVRTPE